MKKHVYEITQIRDDDIVVETTDMTGEALRVKARKVTEQPPCILGRNLGLMYWDYDSSITELGGYAPQAAYPEIYESDDRQYIIFDHVEDLKGDRPLNRFIWEGESDPQKEEELHFIRLRS